MYDIKISYLVASYNHIKFIQETIDSILNQSYKNLELIVLDDCSSDGSRDFLSKYSKEKGFVYFENEQNLGALKTSAKLLELATGDYICFLASDDRVLEDKVSKQLEYMISNNLDAVFGPCIKYFDSEQRLEYPPKNPEMSGMTSDDILMNIYKTGVGAGLVQSGMFKKDCIKTVGYLEGYKSDDFLLQIRILQAGYNVGYLDEPFLIYRIHNSNAHADALRCLNELVVPVIKDFIPVEYQNYLLADAYLNAYDRLMRQNNVIESKIVLNEITKCSLSKEQKKYFKKIKIRTALIKLKLFPILKHLKETMAR